jgi:uncharacterized protein YjiS (DUF1127 family)
MISLANNWRERSVRIQDQLPGGPVSTPVTTSTRRLPRELTDAAVPWRPRVNEHASPPPLANTDVPRRGALSWLKECIIEGLAAYGEALYPCVIEPGESVIRHDRAEDRQSPRRAHHQDRDDTLHSYEMRFGFESHDPVAPYRERQYSAIGTFAPESPTPPKQQRNWFQACKAAIASSFGRYWSRMRQERKYRAMIKGLEVLDDRTLQDIGIPRGEIEYAVRYDRQAE